MLMHVDECVDNLIDVTASLGLRHPLPLTELRSQGGRFTELQQQVDVLVILKEALELHHVAVMEGAMDADLGEELLTST